MLCVMKVVETVDWTWSLISNVKFVKILLGRIALNAEEQMIYKFIFIRTDFLEQEFE